MNRAGNEREKPFGRYSSISAAAARQKVMNHNCKSLLLRCKYEADHKIFGSIEIKIVTAYFK